MSDKLDFKGSRQCPRGVKGVGPLAAFDHSVWLALAAPGVAGPEAVSLGLLHV